MDTIESITETKILVRPGKRSVYEEADHLIERQLGFSPGAEAIMALVLENEEDAGALAEIYCLSLLYTMKKTGTN